MEKKELEFYLACAFLHSVSYHFYDYLEEIEIDDMQTRLAHKETIVDDMAWWLLNEMKNGGNNFLNGSEKVLVHSCVLSYSTKVHTFYHSINELKQMEDFDEKISSFYLYYLECGWLRRLLDVFEQFIKDLNVPELFQKYLDAEPYFEKAKIHLDNELTEVSQKYLPQNKIDILNQKMLQLNQKLATRWLNIVEEASKRFIPKNIHDNE